MNFEKPEKSEFWKKEKKEKKIARDIMILHMCTKSQNHNEYGVTQNFVVILGHFFALLPTTPLTTPKTKILKKWKKHLEMSSF